MKGRTEIKGMNHSEWFDEYKALNLNINEIVLMAVVKTGLDMKEIESRIPQLKECSDEHLVRYRDVAKKDNELWGVIPERGIMHGVSSLK